LLDISDATCRMLAMSVLVSKSESRTGLIEFQPSALVRRIANYGIGQLLAKAGCPLLDQNGQRPVLVGDGLSANDPTATFDQELQDHRVEPVQNGHRYWSPLKLQSCIAIHRTR
jgi:hypothetical protein